MQTIDIAVLRPKAITVDEFNAKVYEWIEEPDLIAVIATPGTAAELDSSRPDGVVVSWTLHFPKTYTSSLKGCRVRVYGIEYKVVGDPQPYMPENTPGAFNRPVEVEAIYG